LTYPQIYGCIRKSKLIIIIEMKRGFTLIELVIVIGILAILAAAVVLVLNPAQILAQARDAQRLSDLGSIKSAIALYLSTSATTTAIAIGPYCTATNCNDSNAPFESATVNSSTVVTGGGWVPVALSDTVGGSPLSVLPLDPTNSGYYFYAFKGDADNKTFELDCRLESSRYRTMMTSDGGNKNSCPSSYTENTCYYEMGTDSGLDL
jgi:prepilin-type N-terminal cleavage/methylation domain-containing protein